MRKLFPFLLLGFLAVSGLTQDQVIPDGLGGFAPFFDTVEGKAHPHIYSTIIYASPDITSEPIPTTYDFTKTIPDGIFEAT